MARIAIVDDEVNCLESLSMTCEAAGHDVETFADPLVALPRLICLPPEVLILNGRMPGMNGTEFFLRFRAFSRAPVIFLSANAEAIADTLLDMGLSADDYIDKPFSHQFVLRTIEAVAHRAAST